MPNTREQSECDVGYSIEESDKPGYFCSLFPSGEELLFMVSLIVKHYINCPFLPITNVNSQVFIHFYHVYLRSVETEVSNRWDCQSMHSSCKGECK